MGLFKHTYRGPYDVEHQSTLMVLGSSFALGAMVGTALGAGISTFAIFTTLRPLPFAQKAAFVGKTCAGTAGTFGMLVTIGNIIRTS